MKKEEYMRMAREMNIRGRSKMKKNELKKVISKETRKIKRRMKGGGLTVEEVDMLLNRDYKKNPMIYREYNDENKSFEDYRINRIRRVEVPIAYQQTNSVFWKREDMDILHIYFYRYDNFNSRIRGKHLSNIGNSDIHKRVYLSPNQKILVRVKTNKNLPENMFEDAEIPKIQLRENGKEPYYNYPENNDKEVNEENIGVEMVPINV